MRWALTVEYAGDAFSGWQMQPGLVTVQGVLEAAIARIAGHPVRLQVAGRTDAGVHATAQVVHFDTDAVRQQNAWVRGVNAFLPPDVAVIDAVAVDDDFHARFLAVARSYRYVLLNRPVRPACLRGRVGWHHAPLEVEPMQQALPCLLGWHDFSSFRAAECQAKSPVKLMREVSVRRQGDLLVFDFKANAFLHHMIRNLVGTLVYVGNGRRPVSWVQEVLEAKSRVNAGSTFMPDGLYLTGIEYPPQYPVGGALLPEVIF